MRAVCENSVSCLEKEFLFLIYFGLFCNLSLVDKPCISFFFFEVYDPELPIVAFKIYLATMVVS